jgi:hypothetical protein
VVLLVHQDQLVQVDQVAVQVQAVVLDLQAQVDLAVAQVHQDLQAQAALLAQQVLLVLVAVQGHLVQVDHQVPLE